MTLSFRQRIALLVALAALTFIAVSAVRVVLGDRAERLVAAIEHRYLPLLQLDRELGELSGKIPRALEDAASAADDSALKEADQLRDRLAARLIAGRAAIADNGGDADALVRELDAYYAPARKVTAALLTDTAAEALGADIEAMRQGQQRFAAKLAAATRPDRAAMVSAFRRAREAHDTATTIGAVVSVAAVVMMLFWSWWIVRGAVRSLAAVSAGMERLGRGEAAAISIATRDEFGDLAREANRAADRLREYRERNAHEDWIKDGAVGLAGEVAGDQQPAALARRVVAYLARYLDAPVGAAYAADDAGTLHLLATFAAGEPADGQRRFRAGEGIIGQAARDDQVRVIAELPPDYLSIRSGLGAAPPRHLLVIPFGHQGRTMGVVELGLLAEPPPRALELAERVRGALGLAFQVAEARGRVQGLLEETQRQAEELEVRQEELRRTNEELAQQAAALEAHRAEVVRKNDDLIDAQAQLEAKAGELARASRYKSEFLASMSHELRTPLNSIMILSRILSDNEDGRLDARQVEFAGVIHKSGEELLALINDVLDLAKVEAGKQDILLEPVATAELADYARRMFEPVAAARKLTFAVHAGADLPAQLRTDRARVEQIVKNLIANALKFTERGGVAVSITRRGDRLAIAVTDTGIGIPRDQQVRIFEAFAQADSGTSRKFGGSGLGLTISRQLAQRLGGDLTVRSEPGAGSTFELVLPIAGPAEPERPAIRTDVLLAVVADDRRQVSPGDQSLLVIEDDPRFAEHVLGLVRAAGFKGLVAPDGAAGLALARQHKPSGIILDVGLPDMDGWSVMERLRADRATREIPVHLITASDDAARARRLGAVGMLTKPVAAEHIRSAIVGFTAAGGAAAQLVLVVDRDPERRSALAELIRAPGTAVEAVGTADEALARVAAGGVGCLLLGLGAADRAAGLVLVDRMRAQPSTAAVPVVVHTDLELDGDEVHRLESADPLVVVRAGERSPQRVLEETRLFLHRVRTRLPAHRQRMTEVVHGQEVALQGKKVLIVDDDMRNVYSLASALRGKEMQVVAAEDGQAALDQLDRNADTAAVLMDVMMPGMDGLEAIGHIRRQPRFAKLPIIALTARTMPGEREKCLDAGADDYVAKPVDLPRLLDLLRVWLS